MTETATLANPIHPSVADRIGPQFSEIYNKYEAPLLRQDQVPYEEYNADRGKYSAAVAPGPRPGVGSIMIYRIPVSDPVGEIDVQVFVPTEEAIAKGGLKTVDGLLPTHVNYHGGGFVGGDLKSSESWCRQVCQAVGTIVVDVDYRLAPEYPHPIPLTDSWTALKWTFDNALKLGIDSSRVSVGGPSAGGHLAAGLSLLARDDPDTPKLVLQLLTVPCVDTRFIPVDGPCDPEVAWESYITNEFAPCLPVSRLQWLYKLWLGNDVETRKKTCADFRASPIVAASHANLAPASIHVAGVDSFTSEGIAYHGVLTKAGTPSTLKIYEGVGHAFGGWDGELDKAREYVQDTIDALKQAYKI